MNDPGRRVFGPALSRARVQCGFASAWQFYHRNGGRRAFPFSYQYYLRIERGRALPPPRWLRSLAACLRVNSARPEFRDLAMAYLTDHLGGKDGFDWLLAPLLGKDGPKVDHRVQAMRRWIRREAGHQLSPGQLEALAADETTYWCFEMLHNDRRAWSAEDLAGRLGFSRDGVSRGLRVLVGEGLAKEVSAGRFKSPHVGKHCFAPSLMRGDDPSHGRLRKYWDRMHKRRGQTLLGQIVLVRAEQRSIQNLLPGILQALDAAGSCSTYEKGEESAFFVLETRVRKLLDA